MCSARKKHSAAQSFPNDCLGRAWLAGQSSRRAGARRPGTVANSTCDGAYRDQSDTTVRTKDLAALVELSSFHFCRAFRDSFGDSPHAYVTRRRIERAQGLMLTTNNSLSQVAMDCGLADQAHFNRLFRRFVGESPGAWRRARAIMVHSADAPKQVQATRLS